MSQPADLATLLEEVSQLDPKTAAERIIQAQGSHSSWLDVFAEQLDRRRNADALKRILSVWDLNQSEAALVFGVSRQAISKWFESGVPAERAIVIAELGAATDLLVRHLKRERIAAVVRRAAARLGDRSLLELLLAHDYHGVLLACRSMFAFGDAHGAP